MHNKYYAIRRFGELYYPSTHNFQIWLAFLAFTLFISTSIVRYSISEGLWYILGTAISSSLDMWQWIILYIGVLFILFSLFALISFIIIATKAICGIKPRRGELVQKDCGCINKEIRLQLSRYKGR